MNSPDDLPDAFEPEDGELPEGYSEKVVDVDGDGIPDAVVFEQDLDGDGIADVSGVVADLDGDGEPDLLIQENSAQSIWGDIDGQSPSAATDFDTSLADLSFPGYADLMETHGTPDQDMLLWEPQDDPMSCAVATTNMMFQSMGLDPGEPLLADIMQHYGIYDPMMGSNPAILDDCINIISANAGLDIQAEDFSGIDIEGLEAMLDDGIRPLIAVDGAELYSSGFSRMLNDIGLLPDAPHAVQLIGIEETPKGVFAVINDPGIPDGAGQRIPIETFKDAWEDMGNSGVAMANASTMAGLNEHLGEGEAITLLGGLRQPVSVDPFGNQFRGDSLIPFAGPSVPKPGVTSFGSATGWSVP